MTLTEEPNNIDALADALLQKLQISCSAEIRLRDVLALVAAASAEQKDCY